MLEVLYNAGPMFYRMTKAALKDHVARNVLSYVDDIVVASRKNDVYIFDLAKTFTNMREAMLKLNPKNVYLITGGKVLSYLVSRKDIKANPDKIRAITQMQPPQRKKDVQKLIGWIASLNQFIAKLAEHNLPFFATLRGSAKIDWGKEQHKAFNDLMHYLEHLLTLSSPEQGQPLIPCVLAT
jgi:hypothetical protein